MTELNRMYGKSKVPVTAQKESDKNPNRVAGGLRGQGSDHYSMLGEDGQEKTVPTHRYVQSLEEQIRSQRGLIEDLKKRIVRMDRNQEQLAKVVSNLDSRL